MPKKVLNRTGNAFAPAGGVEVGWISTNQGRGLLQTIAANIKPHGMVLNDEDNSVPSPIAFIKSFKTKLENGDQKALNTWRGMLAIIALRQCYGFNVGIHPVIIKTQKNGAESSRLGRLFGETLTENSDLTGLTDETQLICFTLNNVPFAMYIPSMVICPFKEVDASTFNNVPWCTNEGEFLDVFEGNEITSGADVTINGRKLYAWLSTVQRGINVNFDPLTEFMSLIYAPNAVPNLTAYAPQVDSKFNNANLASSLQSFAPGAEGFPGVNSWADKMFVIIPRANAEDIPQSNSNFTPMRLISGENTCYVIPPITSQVINCVRANSLVISNVSLSTNADQNQFTYSFDLSSNGMRQHYTNTYSMDDVLWTDTMPYISMWPKANFSNDTWKSHYVAIWPYAEGQGVAAPIRAAIARDSAKISGYGENGTLPVMSVDVICKNANAIVDNYDCQTNFKQLLRGEDGTFKMIKTNSQTEGIEFKTTISGENYAIGCWEFIRNDFAEPPAGVAGVTYRVGLDFGTTSTNIYLKDTGIPAQATSVLSAGEYTGEIYNPYEDKAYAKLIQKYYLFSLDEGKLNKIFTYAINFTAMKNGTVMDSVPFVTGKHLVVDDDYFRLSISSTENPRIYSGLKFPRGSGAETAKKKIAAKNFVLTLLTMAALQAKLQGATALNIEATFPSAENGGKELFTNLQSLKDDLANTSGLVVTLTPQTEAFAAGVYFSNPALFPGGGIIAPASGFIIVDIGGGTTDISYWIDRFGSNEMKCEFEESVKYAGQRLVQRSVMQKVDSGAFGDLWTAQTDSQREAAKSYAEITLPTPIVFETSDAVSKMGKLEFLLEKAQMNYNYINNYETDLISVMRLRYLALAFYVGKKIHDSGVQIDPMTMTILFAGCGSRGLKICKQGIGDFEASIKMMLKLKALENVNAPQIINLFESGNDDKKEVAMGAAHDPQIAANPMAEVVLAAVAPSGANAGPAVPAAPTVPVAPGANAAPAVNAASAVNAAPAALFPTFNSANADLYANWIDYMLDCISYCDPEYKEYYSKYKLSNPVLRSQFNVNCVPRWNDSKGNEDLFYLYMLDALILNNDF